MEKRTVNRIAFDSLIDHAKGLGFAPEDKKGWMKIEMGGRKLYVPKTKGVGRIEVSNWAGDEAFPTGVRALDADEKYCRVLHRLEFFGPVDETMESYHALLQLMVDLPARAEEEPKGKAAQPLAPAELVAQLKAAVKAGTISADEAVDALLDDGTGDEAPVEATGE